MYEVKVEVQVFWCSALKFSGELHLAHFDPWVVVVVVVGGGGVAVEVWW